MIDENNFPLFFRLSFAAPVRMCQEKENKSGICIRWKIVIPTQAHTQREREGDILIEFDEINEFVFALAEAGVRLRQIFLIMFSQYLAVRACDTIKS